MTRNVLYGAMPADNSCKAAIRCFPDPLGSELPTTQNHHPCRGGFLTLPQCNEIRNPTYLISVSKNDLARQRPRLPCAKGAGSPLGETEGLLSKKFRKYRKWQPLRQKSDRFLPPPLTQGRQGCGVNQQIIRNKKDFFDRLKRPWRKYPRAFLSVFQNSRSSVSRKASSPTVLTLKNMAWEPPEVIAQSLITLPD